MTFKEVDPESLITRMRLLFEHIFKPMLDTVMKNFPLIIPVQENQITANLIKLLSVFVRQDIFLKKIHEDNIKLDDMI